MCNSHKSLGLLVWSDCYGNVKITSEQTLFRIPESKGPNSMTARQVHLCERLKRLGFTREQQVKLYGSQFELVGDPLVMSDTVVFFDAVEQKSGELRRVRIPLTIVKMAAQQAEVTVPA